MKINKSTIFQWLKVILPILLMIFAIREIGAILRNANGREMTDKLESLDVRTIALIVLLSLILVFPMFFYDYFIMKKLKLKRSLRRLMKESLIINSFSNLIGFGGLVGVLLRTHYFKKKEVDSAAFFKTITSVTLFYLAGISLFTWMLPIFYRDFPLFKEHKILVIAVSVIGLYVPFLMVKAFIQLYRGTTTNRRLIDDLALVGVSILEWLGALTFMTVLVNILHIPMSVQNLLPIFIVASCAGIVSMIPGGLGSFDLVFIWGAQSLQISEESILVLLLFYRIGYYVVPFLAGLALFIRELWRRFNVGLNAIPRFFLEKTSHMLATALVFSAGLTLLLSSVAPGAIERIRYAKELMAFPIINISHQLAVATGFVLLALSNGISYKDKNSYRMTVFVLLFASALFIIKGIQYKQALFMLFVAGLLYLSRRRFYRESYIVTWGRSILNTVIIFVILLLYMMIGFFVNPSIKYSIPESVKPYLTTDSDDLFKSAFMGLIVVTIVVTFEISLRKLTQFTKTSSLEYEEEIFLHLNKYGGKELSHLIFLHDKYVYWNKEKTVLFPYQVIADKLVVLGDLVGKKEDFKKAIEEFMTFADDYGYTPIFYEISDQFVPYLHGYGYRFFKLGEEGYIDLSKLPYSKVVMRKAENISETFLTEGYSCEIMQPPYSTEVMTQLRDISDEWLDNRKEKGFSLGYFDEDYLQFTPLAVLKNNDFEIIAFANLIPLYDEDRTAKIDLIRSKKGALPEQAMDYLFLNIFSASKAKGFERLNVGLTPLARVGVSKFAGISEKIATQIMVDGQDSYTFRNVRNFKEKFANDWQPKYLAYRKKPSLPFTMLQIMMLIEDNKYATMRKQVSEAKQSRRP
ncbi:bifunctional lysylphosphatidylglycerol flippase/synthetase MprF [Rummeliibacillus sp. SL167]|uniref:bifunctional lysylphosphatidylglycerol flippase/synthetase MprF n=1 Tax=Rummeliibacillus sp. SL167 TaxID=2579792 RepID=UPI0011B716E9|nr:bifunctional lysylphosphatidylglycerol flippase/synthetase MprF [Rummeliibacillus sp. SL167]